MDVDLSQRLPFRRMLKFVQGKLSPAARKRLLAQLERPPEPARLKSDPRLLR